MVVGYAVAIDIDEAAAVTAARTALALDFGSGSLRVISLCRCSNPRGIFYGNRISAGRPIRDQEDFFHRYVADGTRRNSGIDRRCNILVRVSAVKDYRGKDKDAYQTCYPHESLRIC